MTNLYTAIIEKTNRDPYRKELKTGAETTFYNISFVLCDTYFLCFY